MTDGNFNDAKMMKSVIERVENTLGKGENAAYQHFLLFSEYFFKAFFFRLVEGRNCVVKSQISIPCAVLHFTWLSTIFRSYHSHRSYIHVFPGFHQY